MEALISTPDWKRHHDRQAGPRRMVVSPPKRILRTTANRAQVLFNNGIGKARTRIMKLKGSARPSAKGGRPMRDQALTRREEARWSKACQRVLLEG